MKCYKCKDSIESGKSFIPIDAPGTRERRWACLDCAKLEDKKRAAESLGEEGLEVSRIFNSDFLQELEAQE